MAAASDSAIIVADTSIGHSSTAKDTSILQPILEIYPAGFSQVSPRQVDVLHHGFFKLSSGQVCISQIDINKNGLPEVSSLQLGTSENSISQIGLSDLSSNETTFGQISLKQGTIHDRTAEISISENGFIQAVANQVDASKVSLAITVTPEQFPGSHVGKFHIGLPSSNLIALNSTAVSLRQSFHPNFDLTLQVTDLSTGQLTEA
jgi:hypothetical protein